MKVLIVHNRYQQRGGEDAVVDAETRLLASHGVEVARFDADNDSIDGTRAKILISIGQLRETSEILQRFESAVKSFRPDVVHVHNWFPTLSASVFEVCKQAGAPVVHTVHNYRLLCVGATLFRDGRVCEDCLGTRLRTPGVWHRCYRDSIMGSAVGTAAMLKHWTRGTWHRSVDRFIALTEFARTKLAEGGLPADRIVVKPNFVDPMPKIGRGDGFYFLFAGRLTEEKGLRTLLNCWKRGPELAPLWILGDGPLRDEVRQAAAAAANVEFLGATNGAEVERLMKGAKATLCPSLWYEGMPRVVIESLAVGTPVVASKIGGFPEVIVDGVSGALISPGDAGALLDRIRELEQTGSFATMRHAARLRYLEAFTGTTNFSLLMEIYGSAVETANAARTVPSNPGACPA